jgi:hypothetical protein
VPPFIRALLLARPPQQIAEMVMAGYAVEMPAFFPRRTRAYESEKHSPMDE